MTAEAQRPCWAAYNYKSKSGSQVLQPDAPARHSLSGPSAAASRRRARCGQAPKAQLELRCPLMQAAYSDTATRWAALKHNTGVFLPACYAPATCINAHRGCDRQGLDCLPQPQARCLKNVLQPEVAWQQPRHRHHGRAHGAASYLATCPDPP